MKNKLGLNNWTAFNEEFKNHLSAFPLIAKDIAGNQLIDWKQSKPSFKAAVTIRVEQQDGTIIEEQRLLIQKNTTKYYVNGKKN